MKEACVLPEAGLRFPDFLIVGALKAGTTSMYQDLIANRALFFASPKEPENLRFEKVLSDEGRRAYALLFAEAGASQVCGEASAIYTGLGQSADAARRARVLCGAGLKLIYLVREPVSRIVSEHYMMFSEGLAGISVDESVRERELHLVNSRYAARIEPWIEVFGREALEIVKFEDYVKQRRETVARLSVFLGVEPRVVEVDIAKVFNKGEDRRKERGRWVKLARSGVYRRAIRPFVSVKMREGLRLGLFGAASVKPAPPGRETVDFILEQVWDDSVRLGKLMGLSGAPWDLEAVRSGHYARAGAQGA